MRLWVESQPRAPPPSALYFPSLSSLVPPPCPAGAHAFYRRPPRRLLKRAQRRASFPPAWRRRGCTAAMPLSPSGGRCPPSLHSPSPLRSGRAVIGGHRRSRGGGAPRGEGGGPQRGGGEEALPPRPRCRRGSPDGRARAVSRDRGGGWRPPTARLARPLSLSLLPRAAQCISFSPSSRLPVNVVLSSPPTSQSPLPPDTRRTTGARVHCRWEEGVSRRRRAGEGRLLPRVAAGGCGSEGGNGTCALRIVGALWLGREEADGGVAFVPGQSSRPAESPSKRILDGPWMFSRHSLVVDGWAFLLLIQAHPTEFWMHA